MLRLLDDVQSRGIELHSLMVARHGHVVAEGWWHPYSADQVHLGYSLSKTFTASVIGMLVDEGRCGLDDPVLGLLEPGSVAEAHPRWREVTVRHALTMTVGHDHDAWSWADRAATGIVGRGEGTAADPLLVRILSSPPDHAPGSGFAYNQVATYLLARVIEHVTGRPHAAEVHDRLLVPFGATGLRRHLTPAGLDLGFSGLHVHTAAILALAQTYLDEGVWRGERLLSQEWVRQAVRPTGIPVFGGSWDVDWARGYGFSFWVSDHGVRGDGAFGQLAMVEREHGLAVAMTGEAEIEDELRLVWDHLLPSLQAATGTADPGLAEVEAELAARLDGLSIPALGGAADVVAGQRRGGGRFVRSSDSDLPQDYHAVSIEPAGGGHRVVLHHTSGAMRIDVGQGEWAASTLRTERGDLPVVASGGWSSPEVFEAEVRVIQTPHRMLVRADRPSGAVRLTWRMVPLNGADPAALVSAPL